jgi:methylated-DNA-[protein]-cysteine S-methyltransferase
MRNIRYGHTLSYAQQAKAIGKPRAIRAVGSANGANPVPIIVPCHRVIASNGSLGGYALGLAMKRYLLALETATR